MSDSTFDPSRIRWVAFDAVGTLIDPEPPAAAVYHQVGTRHGSRLEPEEVAARFRDAFAKIERTGFLACGCARQNDPLHTCEAREQLRWRTIVDCVLDDVVTANECFDELFTYFGQPSSWRCYAEVEATLASLRRSGLRLAVSSNFDSRLHAVMDGLTALRPIELRIVSSEVRYRKPAPQFFQSLIEAAGCAASELLFVGDDPQNDVGAASAVGIPALRIDRVNSPGDGRTLGSLRELIKRLPSQ